MPELDHRLDSIGPQVAILGGKQFQGAAEVRLAERELTEFMIGLAQGQADCGLDLGLALKRRRDLGGGVVEGRAKRQLRGRSRLSSVTPGAAACRSGTG